ncbi:hypothetical protein CBER1_08265 [Cercospora berteroae]|uniref:Uncharacterized protein n=1 Tax=Cercospora berteroae TaxID=357750 RepID=A0A2S6CET4_9PEZI|nr:hypothetical protein CBER1_08265 [Cercospora berteroae]
MANDKAAKQMENSNNITSKMESPSTDYIDQRKPGNADGKSMSEIAGSSVDEVTAPELNGKVDKMPAAEGGALGAEQSDACHNLFNTVELLENILSKLPVKDLLFAQSVWAVLCTAGLKPVTIHHVKGMVDLDDVFLAKPNAADTPGVKLLRSYMDTWVNPLLYGALGQQDLATYLLDRTREACEEDSFTRPDASCRRMNPSYPSLVVPDSLSSIEPELAPYGLSKEAISRLVAGHVITELEESARVNGHATVSLACGIMQKCDTAGQLAIELHRLKQQEENEMPANSRMP